MMWDPATGSLNHATLHRLYRSRFLHPETVIAAVYRRIAARGDEHVWVSRSPRHVALARAAHLRAQPISPQALPLLWGLPFAIKDNIDRAGVPTTAGCPAYAYIPDCSATVVERLTAAGAIPIGKTNLDQFATGLVGVRSPYGVPRHPFDPAYIPLDLAAIAVPSGFRPQGMPMGKTLIAPAFHDDPLVSLARDFQHRSGLRLGATDHTIAREIAYIPPY